MRKVLLESVALVVIVTIFVSTCVGMATANVPTIVSVENTAYILQSPQATGQGDVEVFVKTQINHPGPTSTHYIDWIEIDFMGETKQVTKTPQSTDSFTVDAYWGRIADWQIPKNAPAKVRVHCTVDGWSAWSNPVPIPEFPVAAIVAFTALAASLFIVRSKPNTTEYRKPRIKQ
jgi:desulfoferrodoxin (superoxide reductase-like protein)